MFRARIARTVAAGPGCTRIVSVRPLSASAVAPAAAGAQQNVKPPVQLFGLDGTYASALYTASAKTSTLDSTDKTLQSLKVLLSKDQKLSKILESPTLNPAAKSAIVEEISKNIGATGNDKSVQNLLEILAENNRLSLVNGVIEQFSTLMKAHKGEVEVVITSAQPLDQATNRRLEAAISKSQFIGQGQKLKLAHKINPELLGGLIVEIGDRTIDLSISSKMAKLNKLLTDAL